ncbi:hypothetical protein [Pseudokineococcus lusitanus]|uniref:Uncharacterized protein n=1 Tax=Pseudokineococcus lusitanus TaxID=763993 RepID=A0A3N1G8M7_9ACTN|nr:hypothetical protein [Pseudokineococcus lusitanus]ROP26583.1 hypothetical protein EDC03_3340 [Pseudokineococcus lusitanus]
MVLGPKTGKALVLLAAAALTATTACASPAPGEQQVPLVTVGPDPTGDRGLDASGREGVLTVNGAGCPTIDDENVLAWPSGSTWSVPGQSIELPDGSVVERGDTLVVSATSPLDPTEWFDAATLELNDRCTAGSTVENRNPGGAPDVLIA